MSSSSSSFSFLILLGDMARGLAAFDTSTMMHSSLPSSTGSVLITMGWGMSELLNPKNSSSSESGANLRFSAPRDLPGVAGFLAGLFLFFSLTCLIAALAAVLLVDAADAAAVDRELRVLSIISQHDSTF